MAIHIEEIGLNRLAYANFMCKKLVTKPSEGKTTVPRGRPQRPSIILPLVIAIAVVFMITLAILVIPLVTVHRVYVTIGQDTIVDVSAQTTKIPEISRLFQPSSYPIGVYTIEVDVQGTIYLQSNVPIGTYTFDLQNVQTGIPLTINVSLIRNGATVNTFSITVTF